MGLILLGIIGIFVFFAILYMVIKGAVEEGTYNALMRYEKDKRTIGEEKDE